MKISKLRNLNDIKLQGVLGVYKGWIYPKTDYSKICNYMQKINYCIQDLNSEIETLENQKMKGLVFVISLVDWIREAFLAIKKEIYKEIIKGYTFSRVKELEKAEKYLLAIRSFVVAHPLTTNQHKKYGFDGNFICVDFNSAFGRSLHFTGEEMFYHIDHDGLVKMRCKSDDFFLLSYSQRDDNMRFYKEIGAKFSDIYHVAELYIENLYELDKYLVKNAKYKNFKIKGESI